VMSLSQISESSKHLHMGFAPVPESEERRLTGDLRRTGSLHIRERGAGFGINESLAATIDEVIEFQVLDREATLRIIAERLDALKARLISTQTVMINIDPQLVSLFADQLISERKSLAQLERILQETIIIPFTQLHLDRHSSGSRPEVLILIKDGAVKVIQSSFNITTVEQNSELKI